MRIINQFIQIRELLLKLNLFKTTIVNINEGIYATRIYIFFFLISMIVLMIFSSINEHTSTVTVHQPTLSQFEAMHLQHAATLSCPCENTSATYSSLITIYPRYHQVCSSIFIKDDGFLQYWPLILNGRVNTNGSMIDRRDFRNNGHFVFILLKKTCNLVLNSISQQLSTFNQTVFVSAQPLSHDDFNNTMTTLFEELQNQVKLKKFRSLVNIYH